MFRILRTLISIVFGIIELLLSIRLIFKFLVVNAHTPFVVWIYGITARLVAPFAKILPDRKFSGFVVDFATLVALIVYVLIGYLILSIFSYSRNRAEN
jgi:hypothetical protein